MNDRDYVLVPRERLATEAERLRYRATETAGFGPQQTDAGAQMVATADQLEAWAAAPQADSAWHPIGTLPHEGIYDLWHPEYGRIVDEWQGGFWADQGCTHWRELPPPPEQTP